MILLAISLNVDNTIRLLYSTLPPLLLLVDNRQAIYRHIEAVNVYFTTLSLEYSAFVFVHVRECVFAR